jgi:hypothetical protein
VQVRSDPVSPEVESLIKDTVRESMERYALRRVDVRAGYDHDGDPVIFVEATHGLSKTPIDPLANAALLTKVRDLLWERGETRFPHIRHKYHSRQEVKLRRRVRA